MKKNIELFVTDMDGTLLDEKHNISPENLAALKELREKGTEVMIATGRLDSMVKAYVKQLGIKTPVISCNGGLIRDFTTNETLYINEMSKSSARKTIEICKDHSIPYLLYCENMIYTDMLSKRVDFLQEYNESQPKEDRIDFLVVDNIFEDFNNIQNILKILIICEKGDSNLHEKLEADLRKIDDISAYKSSGILLDVMNKGVSKGNALKHYLKMKGLSSNKTAAIGDNFNDISMLEFADFSIAMGNAEDDIKAIADLVTKTNIEHGVAHAIREYIV